MRCDCHDPAPVGVEAVLAGLNEERYAAYEAQAEKTMLDRLNKAVDRHQEATEAPVRAVAMPGRVILSLDPSAARELLMYIFTASLALKHFGGKTIENVYDVLDSALADLMAADNE